MFVDSARHDFSGKDSARPTLPMIDRLTDRRNKKIFLCAEKSMLFIPTFYIFNYVLIFSFGLLMNSQTQVNKMVVGVS